MHSYEMKSGPIDNLNAKNHELISVNHRYPQQNVT